MRVCTRKRTRKREGKSANEIERKANRAQFGISIYFCARIVSMGVFVHGICARLMSVRQTRTLEVYILMCTSDSQLGYYSPNFYSGR